MSGSAQRILNFSLVKNVKLNERFNLRFRVEAINFSNTPHLGDPGGIGFTNFNQLTPYGTRIGEVRSLRNSMRIMQFGLKFAF